MFANITHISCTYNLVSAETSFDFGGIERQSKCLSLCMVVNKNKKVYVLTDYSLPPPKKKWLLMNPLII